MENPVHSPEPLKKIRYSIAVPFYNEAGSILALYGRLKETMETVGRTFECLFVDDGSTDDSRFLLEQIALVDSRVTIIELAQNLGKSEALSAAFAVARGEFIITMDGDLQHNPADIPAFIEKLEEGYDIVCGRRTQRTQESWWQRLSNRVANWALAALTGIRIHDWGGGFKAYRRTLVSAVPVYGELQRLIPVLALRRGTRVCEIPITIEPRRHGVSKYGMVRKLPVIFDIMTVRFLAGYLSRPLHFFGTAGCIAALAGSGMGCWLLVARLVYGVHIMGEHGPLLIFAAVLIMAGIQLLAVGLLAEIQVRYHHEDRHRLALQEGTRIVRVDRPSENRTPQPAIQPS
jgi:glycosyltransferase involved in cell wall biosynthesis